MDGPGLFGEGEGFLSEETNQKNPEDHRMTSYNFYVMS